MPRLYMGRVVLPLSAMAFGGLLCFDFEWCVGVSVLEDLAHVLADKRLDPAVALELSHVGQFVPKKVCEKALVNR